MKYAPLWERLVEYLNTWPSAREVPDGIEVTFEQPEGVSRTIEMVIAPDQWDDYVSTIFGDGDPAATGIKSSAPAMSDDRKFLVHAATTGNHPQHEHSPWIGLTASVQNRARSGSRSIGEGTSLPA